MSPVRVRDVRPWPNHPPRLTGEGIGGPLGAVIYAVAGIVTLFLLPIEIKKMYERDGRTSPVGPATAFWILLFGFPWYLK